MRELLVVGPDDISFARRGRNVFFERTPTGRFKQQKFEIIAPEYPKQTFPSIKKGQTAGQLKAEFQRLLPGEKLPAGYTASPNPLGDLIVQPGSSEILGGYQAGRVSPRFLRVAAADADNLISVGILGDTLRPSVFRITPSKGFKLAPGVKSSTKSIQPLGNIKKYIETKAPKGQSTIPFIKAEKESIITQGSILSKPEAKFYFTFEGRRIPIQQTTALAEGVNLPGSISQGEFNKIVSSSSSGVGRSGVFTPVDITSQLRKGGSSVSVSSSSIAPTKITLTPPYSKVSSKKSSSISSIISSARSSTSKARPSASRSISSRFSSKISPSSSVLSKASSSVARSISSRVSSGVSRSRVRPSRIPITPKPFNNIYSGKGRTQPKLRTAKFKVLGRRFGKFKVIGTARTEKGAFQIGRKFAGSTLGVSFKIPKSKTLKLPGFRTKKEDGGIVFIEPRKRRLKKGGREVLEIQQFKGMKGGKLF